MRVGFLAIGAALSLLMGGVAAAETTGLSADDLQTYRSAFQAADANRWSDARTIAAQTQDKTLAKVMAWLYVVRPASDASFEDMTGFLAANPDWPKLDDLRERAEDAMPDNMSQSRVRAYFDRFPPVSATGKVRYAEALMATGEGKTGVELLRKAWVDSNFGERQEQLLLAKHRGQIRPIDNNARLARLLWDGQIRAARMLMRRVDAAHAALADARLRLQGMMGGVERALRRVPPDLQNDPGLLFDRLSWRQRKGMDNEARAILLHPPEDLVRPELWWQERSIEVHKSIAQGHFNEALRLAEHHGQKPGTTEYADAEWLTGWIGLRLLRDPTQALRHFQPLAETVRYPISRARAKYWEGRAYEEKGRGQEARDAYQAAAGFSTTYYGQLAALRLDPGARPILPRQPPLSDAQREAFEKKELVQVVRALGKAEQDDLKEVFIKRLATLAISPEEAELVADLAVAEMRPDLAVRLARQIWHGEMPLTMHGYPIRPLPSSISTDRALVLAVIRQESAFDVRAVSHAGALGLMQLMPAAARRAASDLGIGYAPGRLTSDPDYNVQVGSAYLAKMLDDFGGNYVLALAAYNAGPSRVRTWMRENGDPRSPQIDLIDWIEMVPFDETRNYVQRVIEALNVYREQLAPTPRANGIEQDLDNEAGQKNIAGSAQ